MRSRIKTTLLYALKYVGVFHVSRFLTRRALRVLCYHGTSIDDEHSFRGTLFMRAELFRRRMEFLARSGYEVLGLDEAVELLKTGSIPPKSVVVTLDDGWYGSLRGAFPVLCELGLPATLYLTTYYAEHDAPVFDVAVGYCLWKTNASRLRLDGISGLGGLDGSIDLAAEGARELASERIVEHGNRHLDQAGRAALLDELARRLEIDLATIRRQRQFFLIPMAEVAKLSDFGIDVQLHTHRHRLDLDSRENVRHEVEDNRARLEKLLGRNLEHLCYPSGLHHPRVYPWLRELGLKSATTTKPGFCYRTTSPFELPRIVDGESVPAIEFEAELAGVLELTRRIRRWLRLT